MPTGDARETPEGALTLQGMVLFAFIPLVLFRVVGAWWLISGAW